MMSAGLLERLAGFAQSQTPGPECWISHSRLNLSLILPLSPSLGKTRLVYAGFHVLLDTICIQNILSRSTFTEIPCPCPMPPLPRDGEWPTMAVCEPFISYFPRITFLLLFPLYPSLGKTRQDQISFAGNHVLLNTICIQDQPLQKYLCPPMPSLPLVSVNDRPWNCVNPSTRSCPGISLCNSYLSYTYIIFLTHLTCLTSSAHQ